MHWSSGDPTRSLWLIEESNELRRLIATSATMQPIHWAQQPLNRRKDTTYYNPQVKEKLDPATGLIKRRVCGTIGGDWINYPGDVAARTADMEVIKVLLNAVVSESAEWMTAD